MSQSTEEKMLSYIAGCKDAGALRRICQNAAKRGATNVEKAASLKLYEILPSEEPGSLEHDVWKSIYALEHSLSTERQKTTRLQRTRNKIAEVGERETVKSLVLKEKASEGFGMLIERGMPELTFEALVLRYPETFGADVINAARKRLDGIS